MTATANSVKNSLIIVTDQHRTDTIGALGGSPTHTPVLDDFASEGFAFTQAFTPTAICTPARASLLTGKAPFKHGVLANHEWNIGYQTDLQPEQWTYTQELRDHGYNVGLIGKFHAGEEHPPSEFGMDDLSYEGAINPVMHEKYQAWLKEKGYPQVSMTDPIRGTLPGGREGHLLAGRLQQPVEATFERFLTEQAIAKLREYAADYKDNGKPFSLSVHYFGPHLPYLIPSEYFDLIDPSEVEIPPSYFDTLENKPPIQANYALYWSTHCFTPDEWRKIIAIYRGYVAMIDAEIGMIVDELKNLGLEAETARFFTSDHGEFTGSHRMNDKGPAVYDDIYNIPMLAHIPGVLHSGTSDAMVSLLDVPATVLDLAGLDASKVEDGRSLLDLTREDAEPWREDLVLEFHGHHFHMQQRALRTPDFYFIANPESIPELYDLRVDPYQLNNVYDHPMYEEDRRRLVTRLYYQLKERGDEVFARWLGATHDCDVDLGGTSKSDYDEVTTE